VEEAIGFAISGGVLRPASEQLAQTNAPDSILSDTMDQSKADDQTSSQPSDLP